jgi:hypothetical protein
MIPNDWELSHRQTDRDGCSNREFEFERSSSHDRHDQRGWVFARTVESWKKLGFRVVGLCREFWVLLVGNKQHTSKKIKDPRSWVEVRGLSCGMMMRMMMIPHLLGMMMMMTMME